MKQVLIVLLFVLLISNTASASPSAVIDARTILIHNPLDPEIAFVLHEIP